MSDRLDDILQSWGLACMEVLAPPRLSPEELAKARAQARQQLVGWALEIVGDREELPHGTTAGNNSFKRVAWRNELRAELRDRLKGEESD